MISKNPIKLEQYRLHDRFGYLLSKLGRQMQNRLGPNLERHGITRLQWVVLCSIEVENMRSPSELADHIGVSRPAISRLLNQVESQGLIQRSPVGEDARTRQISLTSKGLELLHLCWPYIYQTEDYFLNKLSDTELSALLAALSTMMAGEELKEEV